MLTNLFVLLITMHVSFYCCFSDINISQGNKGVEFERSTKKRIGPSTRFYDNNFGWPRTWFDLPGGRARLARTPAYFSI